MKKSVTVKLSDLVPYEKNNKIHWDNVDHIAKSIKRNGYITPIIVDENNEILAWHGRKLAMQKLWIEEAEVMQVTWLTDKQKRDFRIADNKTTELSEWNLEAIEFELWEIDSPELNELFPEIDLNAIELDEDKEDEVPEMTADIIVEVGDIFTLGEHRLMCGDSMQEASIKKLLANKNKKTTHCISDPPYWIEYSPDAYGMIKNDDRILDYTHLASQYTDWYFCMWTWYQVVEEWITLIKNTFWCLNNMIIRHKWGGWMWDTLRNLSQDFEIMLVVNRGNTLSTDYRWNVTWYWNTKEKQEFIRKAKRTELQKLLHDITEGQTLWKVKKDLPASYLHPTQKPVEINERVLWNFTSVFENVLDLFLWSGSNLLACEKMRRVCYGMELDPKYIQVILKRYHDYTKGQKEIKCITRELDLSPILYDGKK